MSAFRTLRCLSKLHSSGGIIGRLGCTTHNLTRLYSAKAEPEYVTVNFKLPDGQKKTTKAKVGTSMLDVVIDNNIGIDGFGACEGTLACSTCHLVFAPEVFKNIPNKATDEELDMLDLAYGLTDTSRLGCQVLVSKDMENIEMEVPAGVADARD